ncbi:hypothetical protein FNV43_RR09908 [Rhamnella rubrinervis]|uniref:Uncharacterized protein n=1 Tax=Rhamnella rubrinervis TaxID=2594499 RepID=A0A8K0MKT5_9ROSA|nr:hypothetical protein FNV43_RR09908 [Rhamnella rubrinervis]
MKENWSNLNLGSAQKTKESFFSHGCEVEKVETLEKLMPDNIAHNNNFLHSTSISQSNYDDSNEEFSTESIDIDDEEITPEQMVMRFLESAHNNLLNYFNKEVEVPKVKSSKSKIRKRTEASPAKDVVASTKLETNCIKIKEHNLTGVVSNPVVVDQTTLTTVDIAKVEANPTAADGEVNASSSVRVEANKGRSLVVLPSYNEQCDLINHIPWSHMLDLISQDH